MCLCCGDGRRDALDYRLAVGAVLLQALHQPASAGAAGWQEEEEGHAAGAGQSPPFGSRFVAGTGGLFRSATLLVVHCLCVASLLFTRCLCCDVHDKAAVAHASSQAAPLDFPPLQQQHRQVGVG